MRMADRYLINKCLNDHFSYASLLLHSRLCGAESSILHLWFGLICFFGTTRLSSPFWEIPFTIHMTKCVFVTRIVICSKQLWWFLQRLAMSCINSSVLSFVHLPHTMDMIALLSASMTTWSHWSPWSSFSSARQTSSFFPHKIPFLICLCFVNLHSVHQLIMLCSSVTRRNEK